MKHKAKIALALYGLSSITVLAGAAVAPALSEIARYFADTDTLYVRMIITLPALVVIPCTIIVNRLAQHYSKKPLLMLGLLMYFIGGCGAAFSDSIAVMLSFRALLGAGMGFITPLCHSLPADFFDEDEKLTVVARMSAFITIGACICTVIAGWLVLLSWRAAFIIYAQSIAVMALVLLFIPYKKAVPRIKTEEKAKLPPLIYGLAVTMFLYMAAYYVFPLNTAIYLEKSGLGDARLAGILLAVQSLLAFMVSLYFNRISNHLGRFTLPTLLLCMSGGYFLMWSSTDLVAVTAAIILAGIGLGGLTPIHYLTVNRTVEHKLIVRAISAIVSATFAGQFISPFWVKLCESLPNADHRIVFLLTAAGFSLAFVASLIVQLKKQDKKEL